jgi:ketosteroid isomerase-like protein
MDDDAVLDRLFSAIIDGDLARVRSCFTPDARIWHGYDCITHDVDSFVESLERVFATGLKLRYDDIRRQRTPTGAVQQYLFVVPSPDGGWTAKPCCLIAHLKGGLIERIQEYLDRTGVLKADTLPVKTPGL